MEKTTGHFHCDKVDILSYSYGKMEHLISSFYLQWIHKFPTLYSQIYQRAAVKGSTIHKRYHTYEWLFIKKLKTLLDETRPDLVICTHALPSYLLTRLKEKNIWSGKIINVYTDYFVNRLWGLNILTIISYQVCTSNESYYKRNKIRTNLCYRDPHPSSIQGRMYKKAII
ncbi:hypothetical protein ACI2OX_11785 [Bacillus sp. N9]